MATREERVNEDPATMRTPLPWEARGGCIIAPSVAKEDSRTATGPFGDETWAFYGGELVAESINGPDARFIVTAVNAHEDLHAALVRIADDYELLCGDGLTETNQPPVLRAARAAIAKATEVPA